MASYSELRSLFTDDDLRNRVTAATVIAARDELALDPGTVDGRVWALKVLRDPNSWGRLVFMSVLAENVGFTVAQIKAAADTAILSNVNSIRAKMIVAEAAV